VNPQTAGYAGYAGRGLIGTFLLFTDFDDRNEIGYVIWHGLDLCGMQEDSLLAA
jgi:hypothetical protein